MHWVEQIAEDAVQAHALSHPPVRLYWDPRSHRILTGPFRGQDLDQVASQIRLGHQLAGRDVLERFGWARPWWRFCRVTRVLTLELHPGGTFPLFDGSFDDTGPS